MGKDVGGYNYTKPRRPVSGMTASPGPIYKMRNLTGYNDHETCSSFRREPAYTIATRTVLDRIPYKSPGPAAYRPLDKQTHMGIEGVPAYTMAHKGIDLRKDLGPGPGAYEPEKYTRKVWPNEPAYTFGLKHLDVTINNNPGPNAYKLPRPETESHIRSSPAYTIVHRPKTIFGSGFAPGPGAYKMPDADIFLPTPPKYTMASNSRGPNSRMNNPGPGQYKIGEALKNQLPRAPEFTFGLKHSPYKGVYLDKTLEDED